MAAEGAESVPDERGERGAAEPAAGRPLHARSFKLRFASHREQGRSYVSLVKPLGLRVTDSPLFRACMEEDETAAHLLLSCPVVADFRAKYFGNPAATVTGKFYVREQAGAADEAGTRRALQRLQDMFERGPRDKYAAPVTSSQVVGWWAHAGAAPPRADRRLQHHVRDSAWLKARLCVLAADEKLKQR